MRHSFEWFLSSHLHAFLILLLTSLLILITPSQLVWQWALSSAEKQHELYSGSIALQEIACSFSANPCGDVGVEESHSCRKLSLFLSHTLTKFWKSCYNRGKPCLIVSSKVASSLFTVQCSWANTPLVHNSMREGIECSMKLGHKYNSIISSSSATLLLIVFGL